MGKKLTARQRRILEQGQNVLDSLQQLKQAINTNCVDRYGYERNDHEEAKHIDSNIKRFEEQLEYDVHHSNHKTRYVNRYIDDVIEHITYDSKCYKCGIDNLTPLVEELMKEVIVQSGLYEEIMNTPTRGENFNKLMKQMHSEIRRYINFTRLFSLNEYSNAHPEYVKMARDYNLYLLNTLNPLKARNIRAVLDNDTELETLKTTLVGIRERMFPSENNNELNPIFTEITENDNLYPRIKENREMAVKKLQESQPRFLKLYDDIMSELEKQD